MPAVIVLLQSNSSTSGDPQIVDQLGNARRLPGGVFDPVHFFHRLDRPRQSHRAVDDRDFNFGGLDIGMPLKRVLDPFLHIGSGGTRFQDDVIDDVHNPGDMLDVPELRRIAEHIAGKHLFK